jgi:hypothetical protein
VFLLAHDVSPISADDASSLKNPGDPSSTLGYQSVEKRMQHVMLSEAKHPGIFEIKQIQGFFVAFGSSE